MASATPLPDVLPDTDTDTERRRAASRPTPSSCTTTTLTAWTSWSGAAESVRVHGAEVHRADDRGPREGPGGCVGRALEVAELKADQIRSCGADPQQKAKGAQPLGVSVEPAA